MASVEQIVADACREAGVSVTQVRSTSKNRAVVRARRLAAARMRAERAMSWPEIAREVGHRSHVTVMKWGRGGSDGRGSDGATERRSDEGRER